MYIKSPEPGLLQQRTVANKGQGMVLTRDVQAGEVVLEELPAVLYVCHNQHHMYCANCLRCLNLAAAPETCAVCGRARFCSRACAQIASSPGGSHIPVACHALRDLHWTALSDEEADAARLLLAALSLRMAAASGDEAAAQRYNSLTTLHSTKPSACIDVEKLHRALTVAIQAAGSWAPALSLGEVVSLLSCEGPNSYGVLAPNGEDGERRLRGSGVYAQASRINHECIPNVARFDDFDAPGPRNAVIQFRALHALPRGEEVLQSYVPMSWRLRDRQQHCREVFDFSCSCPRCVTESHPDFQEAFGDAGSEEWQEEGEGSEAMDMAVDDETMQEPGRSGDEEATRQLPREGEMDPTYLSLFLMKYICPHDSCQGTLAPLSGTDRYECNICHMHRTEQEFLQELEDGS